MDLFELRDYPLRQVRGTHVRAVKGHAEIHYKKTNEDHCLVMEMETKAVHWLQILMQLQM
jgi:hypothetical protein